MNSSSSRRKVRYLTALGLALVFAGIAFSSQITAAGLSLDLASSSHVLTIKIDGQNLYYNGTYDSPWVMRIQNSAGNWGVPLSSVQVDNNGNPVGSNAFVFFPSSDASGSGSGCWMGNGGLQISVPPDNYTVQLYFAYWPQGVQAVYVYPFLAPVTVNMNQDQTITLNPNALTPVVSPGGQVSSAPPSGGSYMAAFNWVTVAGGILTAVGSLTLVRTKKESGAKA